MRMPPNIISSDVCFTSVCFIQDLGYISISVTSFLIVLFQHVGNTAATTTTAANNRSLQKERSVGQMLDFAHTLLGYSPIEVTQ